MLETLRRILDVFATSPQILAENPEDSERRKTPALPQQNCYRLG